MTKRRTRNADKTSYSSAMDLEQILKIEEAIIEEYLRWSSDEAAEEYGQLRVMMMRAQFKEQLLEIEKAKAKYESQV